MDRASWLLGIVLATGSLVSGAGCMSAETSEASQLNRLERGIDNSTTPLDHWNSHGELAESGKPPAAPVAPPITAAAPPVAYEPSPEPEPVDGPRPTIRVWGTPGGHGAVVSSIVYGDAGATPPAAPAPKK